MKLINLIVCFFAWVQFCSGHRTNVLSALRNEIFQGYQKDAKPDAKVEVKAGMKITKISLCPHKQVRNHFCYVRVQKISLDACVIFSSDPACVHS